jgi:RNA recognition motif-containing protein
MLFDQCGVVQSIKIVRKGQVSLGYAFVKMLSPEHSKAAINLLGTKLLL